MCDPVCYPEKTFSNSVLTPAPQHVLQMRVQNHLQCFKATVGQTLDGSASSARNNASPKYREEGYRGISEESFEYILLRDSFSDGKRSS